MSTGVDRAGASNDGEGTGTASRVARFYLPDGMRKRAMAGEHNFLAHIVSVLEAADFEIVYHSDSLADQAQAVTRPGFSLFHMIDPIGPRGLTLRRNYFYPFWNIERTAKRWEWPVAQAAFDPALVPQPEARNFARFWARRQFGQAPRTTSRDGFVYVPLQGRLLAHRSFQSYSPLAMLETLLEHDPARNVIATLHPRETYQPAELAALEALVARHQRLSLGTAPVETLLAQCDYVATQNSSVALSGYLFRKPAVLFARIDFHHIAASVHEMGAAKAIAAAPDLAPDFDAYIWWFLQKMSINAGREGAKARIAATLRRGGWPV